MVPILVLVLQSDMRSCTGALGPKRRGTTQLQEAGHTSVFPMSMCRCTYVFMYMYMYMYMYVLMNIRAYVSMYMYICM